MKNKTTDENILTSWKNPLKRKMGFYERYTKRSLDILLSLAFLGGFGWLLLLNALLIKFRIGSPVIFQQFRPGIIDPKTGKEKIFKLFKFRTMTNEVDENGKLLPDEKRMTRFGSWLRSTSMDELPEIVNILKGDLSFVGPRPQLIKDLVFMNDSIRRRHTAKPGLTGLAQANGRNAISWDKKFELDLEYCEDVTLAQDIKILIKTFKNAVLAHEGITEEDSVTATDYGDYLLKENRITQKEYDEKMKEFRKILQSL